MSKQGTVTNQIIEMAGRQGGIASNDIPGLKSEDLSARCCALVRRGILFRGGSGRGKIRYFATEEAAKAHDAENTHVPDVTISQRSKHRRRHIIKSNGAPNTRPAQGWRVRQDIAC